MTQKLTQLDMYKSENFNTLNDYTSNFILSFLFYLRKFYNNGKLTHLQTQTQPRNPKLTPLRSILINRDEKQPDTQITAVQIKINPGHGLANNSRKSKMHANILKT